LGNVVGVKLRRRQELGVHPRHAARRVADALVRQVDAEALQQRVRGPLGAGEVDVAATARGGDREVGQCLAHRALYARAERRVLPPFR